MIGTIIVALRREARIVKRAMRDVQVQMPLKISGMGPTRATLAARTMLSTDTQALISVGFAGALRAPFTVGDLIIPNNVINDAGRQFAVDADLHRRLVMNLSNAGTTYRAGTLYSSAQVINDARSKAALAARVNADVVDMESAAIAAVAEQANIPFVVLRVISDGARQSIPYALNGAIDAQGRVLAARLSFALMIRPWEIVDLIRLGVSSTHASRALASALRCVLAHKA